MSTISLTKSLLNTKDREYYDVLLDGIKRGTKAILLPGVTEQKHAENLLFMVFSDNPEIINCFRTTACFRRNIRGIEVQLTGQIGTNEGKKRSDALDKAVEDAMFIIDRNTHSDKDLITNIYQYIEDNVKYDDEELRVTINGKQKHFDAHSAYGALVEHKALCSGISSAFLLLCRNFGLRAMTIDGISTYHTNEVDHAWNIVEYEGQFYHLDPTWDANLKEDLKVYSYSYFGLNDDEMSLDHSWDLNLYPKCDGEKLSYFKSNNLIAQSLADIPVIMSRLLAEKSEGFQFKVKPGIAIPGDSNDFFSKQLDEAMRRAKMNFVISLGFYWDANTNIFTGFLINN